VLQKHEKLKLNLAHFGGDCWNGAPSWSTRAAALITVYDNVYADLSCAAVPDNLQTLQTLVRNYPKLADRLMFGTDWPMCHLSHRQQLTRSHRILCHEIPQLTLANYMDRNARRFLGLPEQAQG
jgi:predicted TIM-barrel fold metal-dependent hydrolase